MAQTIRRNAKPVRRQARAHGNRFYNFRGLEAFRAKMEPDGWETIYAIAPGPRFKPAMLHAVAGVFSGGSPEWLVARAISSTCWMYSTAPTGCAATWW